jgi:uncharacterized protein (DUF1684 family)
MSADYIASIEAWRAEMEAQLRAPAPWGWLAFVGLYPLKKGKNSIGSHPRCDIPLPEGAAPERLGIVSLDGQQVHLQVNAQEIVTVDGAEVRRATLREHQAAGGMSVVRVRSISLGVLWHHAEPASIGVWNADSPLRQQFPGRAWYPVNPVWKFTGEFIPHPAAYPLMMSQPYQRSHELMHIGNLYFTFRGEREKLIAMKSEWGPKFLKVMLRDATNKTTTYRDGRILQVPLAKDRSVEIDFNRLVHPPAAFSPFIRSPLPPIRNSFLIAIEAGERLPE